MHIKQNQELYENFKLKYEDAIETIKNIDEDKTKESNIKDKLVSMNKVNYISCFGSPNQDLSNTLNESLVHSPTKEFNLYTSNSTACSAKDQSNLKVEIEKLKDELMALIVEKKALEVQLTEQTNNLRKLEEAEKKVSISQSFIEATNLRLSNAINEKYELQSRYNKIAKENFELLNNQTNLKESLNFSEKEKNTNKQKISTISSKLKLTEKDLNINKKKNQALNFQIKNLTFKLNELNEEKITLEKRKDELVSSLENKLELKELEKRELFKDPLYGLLNSIQQNKIEFKFNNETDKIDIFFENVKIFEALNNNSLQNTKDKDINIQKFSPLKSIENIPNYISSNNKHKETYNSPDKKFDKMMSLGNIFTKSSKRFSECSNSNNKVNLINLSSANSKKQNRSVVRNENDAFWSEKKNLKGKLINSFNFNGSNDNNVHFNQSNFENCIKSINLTNSNTRYFLTSNTYKHKPMFALNEVLKSETESNNDDEQCNFNPNLLLNNNNNVNDLKQDCQEEEREEANLNASLNLLQKFDVEKSIEMKENLNFKISNESSFNYEALCKETKSEVFYNFNEYKSKLRLKKSDVYEYVENPRKYMIKDSDFDLSFNHYKYIIFYLIF